MKNKFYAYFLVNEAKSGVTSDWKDCESIVKGKVARYKSFKTEDEAKQWLEKGALYEKKAASIEKKIKPNRLDIENRLDIGKKIDRAVFFDSGTGRGRGTEIRVTDKEGISLLKENINEFGNIELGFDKTNNYGELMALSMAIDISMDLKILNIYGDSNLVIEYWSKNRFNESKLAEETVKLINQVYEKRKYFEMQGGTINHISGDINPADLGFHK